MIRIMRVITIPSMSLPPHQACRLHPPLHLELPRHRRPKMLGAHQPIVYRCLTILNTCKRRHTNSIQRVLRLRLFNTLNPLMRPMPISKTGPPIEIPFLAQCLRRTRHQWIPLLAHPPIRTFRFHPDARILSLVTHNRDPCQDRRQTRSLVTLL